MFLERLSSFGLSDSIYYVPQGVFNTAPVDSDIQMPNCTMYAYLRSFEAVNALKPFHIARKSTGFGNAKTWYSESPLKKGAEIRTGSIACFDGNYGHVAFVERKIDENHALISESQYDEDKSLRNYKYWQKRVVELEVGKATLSGVGELQGFLYLDIDDIRTSRNDREQIEILEDFVNVRTSPNGDLLQKGCYAPMGIYNVLSKEQLNGYWWYQIDRKGWVREGEWLKYYEPESDLYADLREIKRLIEKWV